MENNNPKTCEEYVLNQFFKTEVELATTQKELQETKTQLENANELVEICKELSKYIVIKKEDRRTYNSVYLNKTGLVGTQGTLIGFTSDRFEEENAIDLLVKLVEHVAAISKE